MNSFVTPIAPLLEQWIAPEALSRCINLLSSTGILLITMQPPAAEQMLVEGQQFADWASLNDTIMGGNSRAGCRVVDDGLLLEGELIERGGGFVSCRSPRLQPPLDLSPYSALQLDLDGEGRTLKIAIGCRDGALGLTELIPGGLRWVIDVPTNPNGTTQVVVPFADLRPTVRHRGRQSPRPE